MTQTQQMPHLHVRYNGNSIDVPLDEIDLGDVSTNDDVLRAAAQYLNQPVTKFSSFEIDRNEETGDITVRPPAVFG